jgi:hypothetical protein
MFNILFSPKNVARVALAYNGAELGYLIRSRRADRL